VKSVEEGGPNIGPAEIAASKTLRWKDASITQMINRYVPERFLDACLKCFRNG